MTRPAALVHSVPVVRFRVGELHAALAADSVDAISAPAGAVTGSGELSEVIHIAQLLSEPPQVAGHGQRWIRVRHAASALELVVDGPLVLVDLTVRDILPARRELARSGVVLGFARLAGDVVALLSVAKLLEVAHRDPSAPSETRLPRARSEHRDASERP